MLQPPTNQTVPAADYQKAFAQTTMMVSQVVRQMREIPELPSEKPKDVEAMLKVEFPEEGGVMTYLSNHEYPYRGFPFAEFVEKIDILKKIARAVLSGLYHALKKRKLMLITFIPGAWVAKVALRVAVYVFYRVVERFRIKPHMYCTAIRELRRAFTERGNQTAFRRQLRDLVCMVLEFDNAYRFRLQDIIAELDKKNAKKDLSGEITRLLEEMQKRERGQDIRDTWTLLRLFIRFYLWFDGELRRIISEVIEEIDVSKVILSPSDKHYCAKRQDYTFPWMTEAMQEPPKDKQNRLILEKVFWQDRRTEKENTIRADYIKLVDALNTRQAIEKEQTKDDLTERHKQEHETLVHSFDPVVEQMEKETKEELEEIIKKYS